MPVGKHIEQHIKDEIILKIRDGGLKVTDAADLYGISSKTIYAWLRVGVVDGNRNLILENNRLKKELEIAYRVLGRATAEMQRSKD
jgi:predicted site-specific integrase-resolvase